MAFWIVFIFSVFLCFAPVKIGGLSYSNLRRDIGFALIIIITIFRFDVGFDYKGYYLNLYPFLDLQSYNRLEPFGKMAMNISDYYKIPQIFFILYGLTSFSCLIFALRKFSNNIFLSVLFYIAFFYLPSLSTIRQEAAVCITLSGYYFIYNKMPIWYFLLCIVASLFHTSAIIAIIFYPFFNLKTVKRCVLATIIAIVFIGVIMKLILTVPSFAAYYHYIEDADEYQGGSIIRYLYLGISILLFVLSYRGKQKEIIKMSLLSIIGCSLTFILGGHIGGRIAEYFTIYLCIGIANICAINYKKYIIPIGLSLTFLFIINIYISSKNINKSPYIPYQSIFFIDQNNPKFK